MVYGIADPRLPNFDPNPLQNTYFFIFFQHLAGLVSGVAYLAGCPASKNRGPARAADWIDDFLVGGLNPWKTMNNNYENNFGIVWNFHHKSLFMNINEHKTDILKFPVSIVDEILLPLVYTRVSRQRQLKPVFVGAEANVNGDVGIMVACIQQWA